MTTHQQDPTSASVEAGARIHALMWRKKISQAEIGRVIGVGQSTVSAKIRGRVPITLEELVRIAGVLGVDPGELLPRLDSNQQPSGYESEEVGPVVDLPDYRRRRLRTRGGDLRVAACW